jgi:hypothetical protein
MLAFFLFIALTNLTLGIVLGYFYGPLFVPGSKDAVAAHPVDEHTATAPSDHHAPADAPVAKPAAAAVASATATTPPADDVRPVKPTGSREVSAGDLADVMSELGVPTPAPVAAPAPEAKKPAAAAPPITFEALTGEPAPLAG